MATPWRYPDGDVNVRAARKDGIVGFGLADGTLACLACVDNGNPRHTHDPRHDDDARRQFRFLSRTDGGTDRRDIVRHP